MHHEIKENIDAPYRVFTYDYVNGTRRWSLFVLFDRKPDDESQEDTNSDDTTNKFPDINFDGEALPASEIAFADLPLHILIKLLQVAYTRIGANSLSKNRFVGQDKCYVYARRNDEEGHFHKCLEMEVRGDIQNENIFYIEGHARTFIRDTTLNPDYINQNVYFSMIPIKDNLILFNQVKRSTVQQYVAKPNTTPPPLYSQRTITGKRTTLDFHSVQSSEDTEQTRGYLTDTFIRGFSNYLRGWDFKVEHIERKFTEFDVGEIPDFSLDFDGMERIVVYDARLAQNHHLNEYLNQFRQLQQFQHVNFEVVQTFEEAGKSPVIVFQDCEARAFNEGMPLHGKTDPHEDLYRRFPHTPKQFVNVNPNILTQKDEEGNQQVISLEKYLTYDLIELNENQIAMVMNQLFIKDVILNKRRISTSFPATSDYLFVHREHRMINGAKRRFQIAMRFENDHATFYDLINKPDDKSAFNNLLKGWGIDWDINLKEMTKRRRGREDGNDLPDFDVIVGPGIFVELPGADEAILYDYEEIMRRYDEFAQLYTPDELKLADRYDDIVGDPDLTKDMLELWGYLKEQGKRGRRLRKPKNNTHLNAIQLYEALHQYDEFLDSLRDRYPTVNFQQLTNDEQLVPYIVELFGSPLKLQNKYKKIGMFQGLREADLVSVYRGIWHTDDHRYVVGSPTAMDFTQARAHRIRQFIVYEGSFDPIPMLEAMSVTFVRHKQYTVYPYYFHLIDMYIENVARYAIKSVDLSKIDVPSESQDDPEN